MPYTIKKRTNTSPQATSAWMRNVGRFEMLPDDPKKFHHTKNRSKIPATTPAIIIGVLPDAAADGDAAGAAAGGH
jgi:hypothetical protein